MGSTPELTRASPLARWRFLQFCPALTATPYRGSAPFVANSQNCVAFSRFLLTNRQLSSIYAVRMIVSTQRCGPLLFIAFVLSILLPLGLRPDRPTCVFLDSPIGRASYLDLSRFCVPGVKPAKLSLHPEEGERAAHDEHLTSLFNLSFDHTLLHTVDTGPPSVDLHGPPVLVRTASRLKLQGLPVPPARKRGETTL